VYLSSSHKISLSKNENIKIAMFASGTKAKRNVNSLASFLETTDAS
jgi:hypothetical protein